MALALGVDVTDWHSLVPQEAPPPKFDAFPTELNKPLEQHGVEQLGALTLAFSNWLADQKRTMKKHAADEMDALQALLWQCEISNQAIGELNDAVIEEWKKRSRDQDANEERRTFARKAKAFNDATSAKEILARMLGDVRDLQQVAEERLERVVAKITELEGIRPTVDVRSREDETEQEHTENM